MSAMVQPGSPYGAQWGAPRTNSLAVWSLVLSLLSLFCSIFTAIPAIICGHIAREQVRRSNGSQVGGGMALAGLIIGYVIMGFFFLALVMNLTMGTIIPG